MIAPSPERRAARRVAVIGGGVLGLTTGLRLAQHGHRATVYEAAADLGGLAGAARVGDVTWDRFYHVILRSDLRLRGLLEELGLTDELRWSPTRTGFYVDRRLVSLSTPLDFLRFPPINLVDKARLAATILYASRLRHWKPLESQTAIAWLTRWSGRRVVDRLWRPLLRAKLGENHTRASAAFIWAIIARMYAARRAGMKQELFGYVEGGYGRILDRLVAGCQDHGVDLQAGTPISSVRPRARSAGVTVTTADERDQTFDAAILTVPCGLASRLCPDLTEPEHARLRSVTYQGICCASVVLRRPLTDYYITNIADADLPFTAVIEMTALVDRARFGGQALVYLPRYLGQEDPFWDLDDQAIEAMFLPALRRMHPSLAPQDVVAFEVTRARSVLALSTLRYSDEQMPPLETSCPGLFLMNSAQIPNGTLNVNETLGVIDKHLPSVLDRLGSLTPGQAVR